MVYLHFAVNSQLRSQHTVKASLHNSWSAFSCHLDFGFQGHYFIVRLVMAIWLMYMNISPLIVYVFFNCLLKISYISPQKQPQIHTIKNNNKTSTQKKKQILKIFKNRTTQSNTSTHLCINLNALLIMIKIKFWTCRPICTFRNGTEHLMISNIEIRITIK